MCLVSVKILNTKASSPLQGILLKSDFTSKLAIKRFSTQRPVVSV